VEVRSRDSVWKTPLILLGVAAFFGLAGLSIHLYLDAALEQHRKECTAIRDTFPVDASSRPAVLGPEEAGNVWELLLPAVSRIDALDPNPDNFDAHGTEGRTPQLMEAAGPDLELCRRAARRRDRSWSGPRLSEGSARNAICALSSKGLLLWRDGRDAEAAEWIVVALTVGTDLSALTGDISYETYAHNVMEDNIRDLLSEHSLTAAQLTDLGRRLRLLRSLRLPRGLSLRRSFAQFQLRLLDADPYIGDDGAGRSGALSELLGWKDCYSLRVAKMRILNDLRSCREELGRLSWKTPSLTAEVVRIVATYQRPYVRSLLSSEYGFRSRSVETGDWDIPAVLVECARFQAEHGRLPRTWQEAGITVTAPSDLILEPDRIVLSESADPLTTPYVTGRFPDEWVLARRK
jgi:hypothetical protein